MDKEFRVKFGVVPGPGSKLHGEIQFGDQPVIIHTTNFEDREKAEKAIRAVVVEELDRLLGT